MSKSPIFIHSLFRAGSTYLFNVFRRSSTGYWCYQEPLHEISVLARDEPKLLLADHGEEKVRLLRHPKIEKMYFQELYDAWPAWKNALSDFAVYNGYFAPPEADIGIPFWKALIDAAQGRPVFQECRTAGRMAAIKDQLGGYHIYLWRNPWDQWWSYKVAPYFDTANQLIINAPNSPPSVQILRTALGLEAYAKDDLGGAFAYYVSKPLSSEDSYLVFYMLWCQGLQEGMKYADQMLNIDRLSDLPSYQDEMQRYLAEPGIAGIDFSDCKVPQGLYLEQDRGFFFALEEQVYLWLKEGGWSQGEIDQIQALRRQCQPVIWSEPVGSLSPKDIAEQASRARILAMRFETHVAKALRDSAATIAQAESRATQAGARANTAEAESRTMVAEARAATAEAESRAAVAEARANTAEAESRTMVAEARAATAEAESRAAVAEARAATAEAESRAAVAEARAATAEAESRAAVAEAKAEQAEARAQEAGASCSESKLLADLRQKEAWQWHEQVVLLHSSTSWRVTKPLRVVKRVVSGDRVITQRLTQAVKRRIKNLSRPLVIGAVRFVLARPTLRRAIGRVLRVSFPSLRSRLVSLGIHANSFSGQTTSYAGHLLDGSYSGKKVAVLAPGAASGTVGGAERFYAGLVRALSEKGCQVDLVCLTVDESSFEQIQLGYKNFRGLDLARYDLVISTKAPTYVVNHPNHILYLVHTVRVFYDMFDEVFPHANAALRAQRDWIHAEDTAAFSNIQKRFSIGTEVSRRLVQWNGCDAEVLHPPLDVVGLYDLGVGDYFYMPGRLHAWKRVGLAIRAIKCSSLPMRLVVSGSGEAEPQLRELAGGDTRIEFLGQVDDETLKLLYAGALAVPFVPIREDYGYVTLEAFASGKPVITCTDSGEPTVFVEHGVSGFVCPPEPQALCDAFEKLWNDRELAARMGRVGRERIAEISWDSVAGRLLQAGFPEVKVPAASAKAPLKVAVLDMQPIMPAIGGGRLRLLGLYHALGPDIQTRYVGTYDWSGEKYRRHSITPTLEEIDVPLSAAHHEAAAGAARKAGGKTVIDMVFAQQAYLSPEYLKETLDAVHWAEVVVFSHPWVAPLVSDELLNGKLVVYDSHNVEAALRSQLLNLDNPFEQEVLAEVIRAEKLSGDRADLVLACSQEDADGFVARYGWQRHRIRLVPNGVFSRSIQPAVVDQKREAREASGISGDAFVGIFLGSDYAPNVEAALFIIERLARELPEIIFAIGGGVCGRLSMNLPANVRAIGFLEEKDKLQWLHACDFAINPMFSGSGTNIKMFDFMSAGLPVVSTPTGARGIAQQSTAGLRLAEREELAPALRQLSIDRKAAYAGGQENRHLVEAKYAWESISPELGRIIRSAYFRKSGAALLASPEAASRLRVAHLSTVGLKCGIGEYTRKIIDIYQQHGISNLLLAGRAANEEPNLENLNIPSKVIWFLDNVEWRHSNIQPEALQSMLDWGANQLIVQYHPGFFSPELLVQFVAQAMEHGVFVTVVVHNFTEEAASAMRRLNDLGVALFSHRMTEVLQAKALGILLDQIPLGIDAGGFIKTRTIAQRDWKKQPPLVVTTGFLRRHKGIVTLIQAMPAVIKRFPEARLLVQCALYPSEDSKYELEAANREIERLALRSSVTLDTRFLDKEFVFAELEKGDVAVLPYENSNEGGSATATDCIAVGLPLIVSNAEIFDEIRDVVLTTQPAEQHIADAILRVLSEPEVYAMLANQSASHACANSWGSIAGAFLAGFNAQLLIDRGAGNGFEPVVRHANNRSHEAHTST